MCSKVWNILFSALRDLILYNLLISTWPLLWLVNRERICELEDLDSLNLTPVRRAIIKKTTNSKYWWRCREKGKFVHYWWDCKLVQPLWRFLKKLKIELPRSPTILLFNIYLKKMKTLIWKDICTLILLPGKSHGRRSLVGCSPWGR